MPSNLPIELLPNLIAATADELERDGFTLDCPEAETDGAHKVVVCRMAQDFLTVRHDPLAIKMWCAGDHTECPIWRNERDGTGQIQRTLKARADGETAAQTRAQIERGIRVDDRPAHERTFVDEHGVQRIEDV